MKTLCLALALLCAAFSGAFAQVPDYALRVSPQEAVEIVNVLQGRPYSEVAPLIGKLQSQIVLQNQAAQDAAVKAAIAAQKKSDSAE